VDGAGNLYVGDLVNYAGFHLGDREKHRIQMRTPQGDWSVIAPNGTALGQVDSLGTLSVDPSGILYTVDYVVHKDGTYVSRIQMRTPRGEWSGVAVGVGVGEGDAPDQVTYPYGVVADSLGNLYVGGSTAKGTRLLRRTAQGVWSVIADASSEESNGGFGGFSLVLDGAGRLYAGDAKNHQIQRYTPAVHFLSGDLNDDGAVRLFDALMVLRIVVGLTPSTSDLLRRGDVFPVKADGGEGDGALTLEDVRRLIQRALGSDSDPLR
jgi:hypothetical protein